MTRCAQSTRNTRVRYLRSESTLGTTPDCPLNSIKSTMTLLGDVAHLLNRWKQRKHLPARGSCTITPIVNTTFLQLVSDMDIHFLGTNTASNRIVTHPNCFCRMETCSPHRSPWSLAHTPQLERFVTSTKRWLIVIHVHDLVFIDQHFDDAEPCMLGWNHFSSQRTRLYSGVRRLLRSKIYESN